MRKGYCLQKRNRFWYLYYRPEPNGKLVGISLKTSNKAEADIKARHIINEKRIEEIQQKNQLEGYRKDYLRFLDEFKDKFIFCCGLVGEDPTDRMKMLEILQDKIEKEIMTTDSMNWMNETKNEFEDYLDNMLNDVKGFLSFHKENILDLANLYGFSLVKENPSITEKEKIIILVNDFWYLADKLSNDSGLYVDWSRNNRSQKTFAGYRSSWKMFVNKLNTNIFTDIGEDIVKQFEQSLYKQKMTHNTVVQHIANLCSIFGTAIKEGWYTKENPFQKLTKKKVNKSRVIEFLSREQVNRILSEAKNLSQNTFLFIAIAAYTGMRKGEVLNLRWEDFLWDVRNGEGNSAPIVLVQSKTKDIKKGIEAFIPKGKRNRSIPLHEELIPIALQYKKDEGYVIELRSGTKRDGWNVPKDFQTIQEKTGIRFTPHLFRHTFASLCAIKGVDIYKISRWLGHSDVRITTDVYAHLQAHDNDINRL